jgi:hypothetical protein
MIFEYEGKLKSKGMKNIDVFFVFGILCFRFLLALFVMQILYYSQLIPWKLFCEGFYVLIYFIVAIRHSTFYTMSIIVILHVLSLKIMMVTLITVERFLFRKVDSAS